MAPANSLLKSLAILVRILVTSFTNSSSGMDRVVVRDKDKLIGKLFGGFMLNAFHSVSGSGFIR